MGAAIAPRCLRYFGIAGDGRGRGIRRTSM